MCCNLVGKIFKYADDLTLLTYGPDSVLALNAMQDKIKCLTKWLNDWRIQASSTKTKVMTFKKKTVETVNEESLTFGDHRVEFVESVKVLGILIDDKLTFSQEIAAATSKALQTFGHVKRSYLNNQSMSPNTFKVLCQAIVIPQWTYLAFIWRERGKFLKSQLWSEIVNLSTCSSYHPKKELLEVIGNLVPIDIQIETHGAKFAVKVFQQSEDDRILRLFENSKTITRKLLADSRTFGSLSSYSQDSMKKIVYRRWNSRLRNFNLSDNFGFQAKREGILPKHLTKAHTKRMVQLLTEHSSLQLPVPYLTMFHSGLHMHIRSRIHRALFIQMPLLLKLAQNHPSIWLICWIIVVGRIGKQP